MRIWLIVLGVGVIFGGLAYMDNRRWCKRVRLDSSDEPMWV